MEELIQTLLLGQAEIDRMRSDIRQIVAMVLGRLGLLTTNLRDAMPVSIKFRDEENCLLWEIWYCEPCVVHAQVHSDQLLFSTYHMGKVFFELDSIPLVRKSLGFFLKNVSSKFPELDELLQLYIDAAKEVGR